MGHANKFDQRSQQVNRKHLAGAITTPRVSEADLVERVLARRLLEERDNLMKECIRLLCCLRSRGTERDFIYQPELRRMAAERLGEDEARRLFGPEVSGG